MLLIDENGEDFFEDSVGGDVGSIDDKIIVFFVIQSGRSNFMDFFDLGKPAILSFLNSSFSFAKTDFFPLSKSLITNIVFTD